MSLKKTFLIKEGPQEIPDFSEVVMHLEEAHDGIKKLSEIYSGPGDYVMEKALTDLQRIYQDIQRVFPNAHRGLKVYGRK